MPFCAMRAYGCARGNVNVSNSGLLSAGETLWMVLHRWRLVIVVVGVAIVVGSSCNSSKSSCGCSGDIGNDICKM